MTHPTTQNRNVTHNELDHHALHHGHEGLRVDLPRLLGLARPLPQVDRRHALRLFGGAGAIVLLAACGRAASDAQSATSGGASTSRSTTTTGVPSTSASGVVSTNTTAATTAASTTNATISAGSEIPDETAGPFPGDGTNGPNALTESGVVRSDIRSSFGSSTTTAEGIPMTVTMTVVGADTGTPISGATVYLWHCDRDGGYSMYSNGITGENYLRGVQAADEGGNLAFTTIFPGCYDGRWPHAHFEVYASLDDATNGRQAIKTTQLALPEATSVEAYATAGYESSVGNLSRTSLDSDGVFRDGSADQIPTMSGNPTDGYSAALVVRV